MSRPGWTQIALWVHEGTGAALSELEAAWGLNRRATIEKLIADAKKRTGKKRAPIVRNTKK